MSKEFRSRSIRLMKDPVVAASANFSNSKIYYDAESSLLTNSELKQYVNKGILDYFEYSEDEYGKIDAFNFHNNLEVICDDLYQNLLENQLKLIKEIPNIFDKSFLNYTIGYRVVNEKILGRNYYFYPTIKKEKGFGIKGITDSMIIKEYINKFISNLGFRNAETGLEIRSFASLMYKFKGISIAFSENNPVEYKVYGRISTHDIYEYLRDKILFDFNLCEKYGDVVLVAQRINNDHVVGYNIYYLD